MHLKKQQQQNSKLTFEQNKMINENINRNKNEEEIFKNSSTLQFTY